MLNVSPPEEIPDVAADKFIWLVPALNVRLVIVLALIASDDEKEVVTVEEFRVTDRMLKLVTENCDDKVIA